MKHLFLIKTDIAESMPVSVTTDKIVSFCRRAKLEHSIAFTNFFGEEEEVVRHLVNEYADQPLRIIVCGNMESFHFAVNGAYGVSNVELGFFPCDGNDSFLNALPDLGRSDIMDIEALLGGRVIDIDLLTINGRYCLNAANIGLDTNVMKLHDRLAQWNERFSWFHIRNKKLARLAQVGAALFDAPAETVYIRINGHETFDESYSLILFANAPKYGMGVDRSVNGGIDDGLIDFLHVKKIPLFSMPKVSRIYWQGNILSDETTKKYTTYRHCLNAEVRFPEPVFIALDGAVYMQDAHFHVRIIPAALRLLIPKTS